MRTEALTLQSGNNTTALSQRPVKRHVSWGVLMSAVKHSDVEVSAVKVDTKIISPIFKQDWIVQTK